MNNRVKKYFVLIVFLLFVLWIIFSLYNVVVFRIVKIYDVYNKQNILIVCFNKSVENIKLNISNENLSEDSIKTNKAECVAFSLEYYIVDNKLGRHYVDLSSNSDELDFNKKITFNIVDKESSNTPSSELFNSVINSNNDVSMEGWMDYWSKQPVYKYIDQPSFSYRASLWSILFRSDDNNKPSIVIVLNMREPSINNKNELRQVNLYKKQALDKIREWGSNPDKYSVKFEFDD